MTRETFRGTATTVHTVARDRSDDRVRPSACMRDPIRVRLEIIRYPREMIHAAGQRRRRTLEDRAWSSAAPSAVFQHAMRGLEAPFTVVGRPFTDSPTPCAVSRGAHSRLSARLYDTTDCVHGGLESERGGSEVVARGFVVVLRGSEVASRGFEVVRRGSLVASRLPESTSGRFLVASRGFLVASRDFLVASRVFLVASPVFLVVHRLPDSMHGGLDSMHGLPRSMPARTG